MDETMKQILEIVTDTQEEISTIKKDVSEIRREMADIRRDIDANTRAIADLAEQLRGVLGYAKEIDLLMSRVSILEKQLGISK